jgi:hypothetical protein
MKKLLIILIFTSLGFAQSQNQSFDFFEATALQTGYAYLGKNYGYLGFDKRIDNRKDWVYANIGAGTYVSKFDDKLQFVPEIHTNIILLALLAEVSLTTKAVNPSLGFNIYNRFSIKSGYNFAYKKDDFEGITFGININFGSDDYHYMSPMKLF